MFTIKQLVEETSQQKFPKIFLQGIFSEEKKEKTFADFMKQKDEQGNSFLSLVQQYGDVNLLTEVLNEMVEQKITLKANNESVTADYVASLIKKLVTEVNNPNASIENIQDKLKLLTEIAKAQQEHREQISQKLHKEVWPVLVKLHLIKIPSLVSVLDGAEEEVSKVIKGTENLAYHHMLLEALPLRLNAELRNSHGDKEIIRNLIALLVIVINEAPELADKPLNQMLSYIYDRASSALPGRLGFTSPNFVQLIVVGGYADIFAEFKNIKDPKIAAKIFGHSASNSATWNSLHAAIYAGNFINEILTVLGSEAPKICTAECYTSIDAYNTTALTMAISYQRAKEIPTILALLGSDRVRIAKRQSQKAGETFLHVLTRENPEKIQSGLRLLGPAAAEISEIQNYAGKTPYDLLSSMSSKPEAVAAINEILIATGDFRELSKKPDMGVEKLQEAMEVYTKHYFSASNPMSLIKILDQLGRMDIYADSEKSSTLAKALSVSAERDKLTCAPLKEATILFLLNPNTSLANQKDIEGMKALVSVLFDTKQWGENYEGLLNKVIKVLEERQSRHDEPKTKLLNSNSRDPNREVNQFFDQLSNGLLKNARLEAYPRLHPCGVAYRLVTERMNPKSGYDATKVQTWFSELVAAKSRNDQNKMNSLMQHHNRPTKSLFSFSATNSEELLFKASLNRFCMAGDEQMDEFWVALEQEKKDQGSNELLENLLKLKPDETYSSRTSLGRTTSSIRPTLTRAGESIGNGNL